MQAEAPRVGVRRIWLRGLLFSALAAPLLGGLLAGSTLLAVRSRPPPSISLMLAIAVTISYVVATGPALVAGIITTSLAIRWQRQGLSRLPIVLRLTVVCMALGAAAALVGASLAVGRLVVDSLYLGPGVLTGLFMGFIFPRVLWGRTSA